MQASDSTRDKIVEPIPMVVDEPVVEPAAQSGTAPRRSGRSSIGLRLRPWNKATARADLPHLHGYVDELDDLSEDYLPPSMIHRRPKRDTSGKFSRKPEGKAVKVSAQPAVAITEDASATEDATVPIASTSRPKRNRQPSRRLESPTTLTSAPSLTPVTIPHARNTSPKTASVHVPPVSPAIPTVSDAQTVNGSSMTARSAATTASSASSAPTSAQSNGVHNSQTVALNVPAPTTLHPSLRYKPIAPAPFDPPPKTEVAAPTRTAPTTRQKPVTPVPSSDKTAASGAVTPVQASSTRTESTTPSTGLKIRLPRMGGALPAAAPASAVSVNGDQDGSSTSRSKTHSSNTSSRPRRSLRRQSSRSTSVTGTSLSTPPSPKLGGMIS